MSRSERPLIAVPPYRFGPSLIGSWTDSGEAVPDAYLAALRRAGAIPVALGGPVDADPRELLEPFGGLLLLGGADLDPSFYGEAPHGAEYGMDPVRDRFELALVRAALAAAQPTLAICRGLQVLNVALGGTLWQHIPDLGTSVAHGVPIGAGQPAEHSVTITSATRLAKLLGGADELAACTSLHHQAIRDLADGLIVTARSADGLIEAVETPPDSPAWCVAVQWHPERTAGTDPAQQSLFDGFVGVVRDAL